MKAKLPLLFDVAGWLMLLLAWVTEDVAWIACAMVLFLRADFARATSTVTATSALVHEKIAKVDATHQRWMESHSQPPPEDPEFVLVAFTTGAPPTVEVSRAEYVRAYPNEYPWWMPLPAPPDQPDAAQ